MRLSQNLAFLDHVQVTLGALILRRRPFGSRVPDFLGRPRT
jgi:hypothetical protein